MIAEKTLILVKPDAFKRKLVGKILQRFEDKGFDIKQLKTFDFEMDKDSGILSLTIKTNLFSVNWSHLFVLELLLHVFWKELML